jgi:hypothetical protein
MTFQAGLNGLTMKSDLMSTLLFRLDMFLGVIFLPLEGVKQTKI